MRRLLFLAVLAAAPAFAQLDAGTLRGKPPCTATRTTRCVAVTNSAGALLGGTSGATAFVHDFDVNCQGASVASAFSPFNSVVSDPSSAVCDASSATDPKGYVSISTNSTSKQFLSVFLPCTPNGSGGCTETTVPSLYLTITFWSTDSTHAAAVQPFFACVNTGSASGLTYASAAASQNLTASATNGRTRGQYTLSTSGCAPGQTYYLYLQVATNAAATGTFNLSRAIVQGQVQ